MTISSPAHYAEGLRVRAPPEMRSRHGGREPLEALQKQLNGDVPAGLGELEDEHRHQHIGVTAGVQALDPGRGK